VYVSDPAPEELLIATILDILDKVIIFLIMGIYISFFPYISGDGEFNNHPPFYSR